MTRRRKRSPLTSWNALRDWLAKRLVRPALPGHLPFGMATPDLAQGESRGSKREHCKRTRLGHGRCSSGDRCARRIVIGSREECDTRNAGSSAALRAQFEIPIKSVRAYSKLQPDEA